MPPRSTPRRPATLTGSVTRRSALLLGRGIASQPGTYVLAIGTSAAFGAFTVAVSRVLGWVTDTVVVPALDGDAVARGRIWWAGGALALVALSLALSVAGRRVFAGMGVSDQQAMWRRGVTRQYLALPMSWHRRHPTGQLLSNASSDVEAATNVFNPLPFALGVVVMIGVAAVALFTTDPYLAVAALIVLPLAVIANVIFQRKMSPAVTRAQELRAEVADNAHESFEAALLVKSLGTEDREEHRFAEHADQLRAANVRVGVVRAYFDPVIDMLPSLGSLLVLVVGVWRARTGAVNTGDIVSAAYLLTLMAVPVRAFGWVLGDLPRALVGQERLARVVDAEGELPPGTAPLPRTPGGAALRMTGVGVQVPGPAGPVPILREVDVDIAPGRVVAVVGPTGAGKTTLVSLVPRLSDPTTGRIEVDGTDVRELDPGDLTDQVVLVGQQTFIFEDTVRGNVTLADPGDSGAPSDDEVWDALRLARVDGVVRALPGGLDAPLGERGSNLSGGQRQRLAIARALVRRPRLLILDDATSAVDPRVERDILTGLRDHTGGAGPTVLLVAYRMSSVALADEVLHLESGRVVDHGTHGELLERDPGYRALATAYEAESERRAQARADALDDEATTGGNR
ncbi:ABC transporter ATP-binding protein [Cellulomonas denverensis]|uniref:ABC transporter ATP-binding protein n=1 Tax=Cellulomonas denverensis TaxID=264297 RepID=A0A7X6KTP7_9CELL|nr:ABC transporter ATP-binding protein [Cellulomonas denverensis]NKY21799.1 ABC transporter ATP-binding protein [Cellulomonas denverensis]GIG24312.1 multidrug ABC transporter ATP-binding protein [Cellulomonas denverensis]